MLSKYQVHHFQLLHYKIRWNQQLLMIISSSPIKTKSPLAKHTPFFMGNRSSIHHHPSGGGAARVVLWDGTIHRFDDPVTAAELMMDHPQQVVVEFDPAATMTGKRATPLPADRKLDVRKVYLMLPVKGGKPASLSTEAARRVLSSANSVLGPRSLLSPTTSRFLPLLARMCNSGAQAHEDVVNDKKDVLPKLEDLTASDVGYGGGPEYLSRQISGKGWKPSLDTIVEKKVENKVSRRLLFSSYI